MTADREAQHMTEQPEFAAAVESAAEAWFTKALEIEGADAPDVSWADLTDDEREQMTTPARWVLEAATPQVEARVRAQIAADIEASNVPAVPPAVGDEHYMAGMRRAASIARGDS